MLITPVVNAVKDLGYFKDVTYAREVGAMEELVAGASLPCVYILQPQERGDKISVDNRAKQSIHSLFHFLIVTEPDQPDNGIESVTEAKEQLRSALIGFQISSVYNPMEMISSEMKYQVDSATVTLEQYSTSKVYKKT